eukprot:574750_1
MAQSIYAPPLVGYFGSLLVALTFIVSVLRIFFAGNVIYTAYIFKAEITKIKGCDQSLCLTLRLKDYDFPLLIPLNICRYSKKWHNMSIK